MASTRRVILDEETGVYPYLTVSSAMEGIVFLRNKYDALLDDNGAAIIPDGYERSPVNIFPFPLPTLMNAPCQEILAHDETKEVKEVKAVFVAGAAITMTSTSTTSSAAILPGTAGSTVSVESNQLVGSAAPSLVATKSIPRLFCFFREKPKQWMLNSTDKMFLQPFYVYVVYHGTRQK